MARSRNIKPAFFKHDGLADVSRDARLLFIGLWTLADFKGRLKAKPRWIKAELFPYDNDAQVESWLDELASHTEKFIVRYEIDGEHYLEIPGFTKHQNPHKREKESGSDIPINPGLGRDKAGPSSGQVPTQTGTGPADSCLLIPDSCLPKTGSETDKVFSTLVEVAYSYFVRSMSQNPNFGGNSGWVKGWFSVQLDGLEKSRPDLTPDDALSVWRDACDLACEHGAGASQWLKTTYTNRLKAYAPKPENHRSPMASETEELSENGQRSEWLVGNFKRIQDRGTGLIIDVSELEHVAPGVYKHQGAPISLIFFDPFEEEGLPNAE